MEEKRSRREHRILMNGKGDVILPLGLLGVFMFLSSGWPAILRATIWGATNLNDTSTTSSNISNASATGSATAANYNTGTAPILSPRDTSVGNQDLD